MIHMATSIRRKLIGYRPPAPEALPQSGISAVLHRTGTMCGVFVETTGKLTWVTWNGAFLLHEKNVEADWGAKAEKKNP